MCNNDQPKFDTVGFIMAWESGEIEDLNELAFGFQQLIDSGTIYGLQGVYQRTARQLVEEGLCHW